MKYSNINNRTIKMKLAEFKLGTYIHYSTAHNKKNPKFKVGDHLIISKYKNILQRGTVQIGQRKSL